MGCKYKSKSPAGFTVNLVINGFIIASIKTTCGWSQITGSYTVPAGVTSIELSVKDPDPMGGGVSHFLGLDDICIVNTGAPISNCSQGVVNFGSLLNYHMLFSNGSVDANWQGATKGFIGDMAIDGVQAAERTSGTVPFSGTLFTNDATGGARQNIINANSSQAY